MTQTRNKPPGPASARPVTPDKVAGDVVVLKGRLPTPEAPVALEDMAAAVRLRRTRIGQSR